MSTRVNFLTTTCSFPILIVAANHLVGAIPEEIGYFSNMTSVEMSESEISGKLPSSLDKLTLLEKLT
jgi:hypothetical protein